MNRILETLAVLRAEGQVSIEDVLEAESQLLPRGTTVIVVTPTRVTAMITTVNTNSIKLYRLMGQ